jgi:HSF-type DNA-binding
VPGTSTSRYTYTSISKTVVDTQDHLFLAHARPSIYYPIGRYFKQTKLTSFQRQMNLYGFQKVSSGVDKGCFYHPLFLRGRPDLCRIMLRTKVKGKYGTISRDTDKVLDCNSFYDLPPCPPTTCSSSWGSCSPSGTAPTSRDEVGVLPDQKKPMVATPLSSVPHDKKNEEVVLTATTDSTSRKQVHQEEPALSWPGAAPFFLAAGPRGDNNNRRLTRREDINSNEETQRQQRARERIPTLVEESYYSSPLSFDHLFSPLLDDSGFEAAVASGTTGTIHEQGHYSSPEPHDEEDGFLHQRPAEQQPPIVTPLSVTKPAVLSDDDAMTLWLLQPVPPLSSSSVISSTTTMMTTIAGEVPVFWDGQYQTMDDYEMEARAFF